MKSIFYFLLTSALLLILDATAPLPPPGCTEELVAFSPCLGYVSAPPNNTTASVSSQCCDVITKAMDASYGYCFCYLITNPLILGFPLNKSRLLSLPSACPARNTIFSINLRSLNSFCSASRALPPRHGTTAKVPPDSGLNALPPTSPSASPALPAKTSPPPESFSPEPSAVVRAPQAAKLRKPEARVLDSSAVKLCAFRNNWILSGALVSLAFYNRRLST